jgi:thiamine kinase-like enzyme
MNKNIENTCVDIKDPHSYTKRLDYLAEKLEKTKECREINRRYSKLYKSLENIIPKEKQDLIRQLDDTYMELLILHEDFFYKNGHLDKPEFKGVFRRIKNWLFGLQSTNNKP